MPASTCLDNVASLDKLPWDTALYLRGQPFRSVCALALAAHSALDCLPWPPGTIHATRCMQAGPQCRDYDFDRNRTGKRVVCHKGQHGRRGCAAWSHADSIPPHRLPGVRAAVTAALLSCACPLPSVLQHPQITSASDTILQFTVCLVQTTAQARGRPALSGAAASHSGGRQAPALCEDASAGGQSARG